MDLMNMPYLGSIKDNVSGPEGCGLFSDRGFALIGICVSVAEDDSGGKYPPVHSNGILCLV